MAEFIAQIVQALIFTDESNMRDYSSHRTLEHSDKPVDPFPYTANPHRHFMSHVHVIGLTLIWTFSDIPILIGRYVKGWKYSYKVHSVSMTIILILHLGICAMNYVSSELSTARGNLKVRKSGHWRGILIMLVLSFVMALSGNILESVYKAKNSKASLKKPLLRRFHMIFGIMMWAAAKYTIYTGGTKFAGKPWLERTFHIGFFFTPIFVALMELYRVFLNKKDVSRMSIPNTISEC